MNSEASYNSSESIFKDHSNSIVGIQQPPQDQCLMFINNVANYTISSERGYLFERQCGFGVQHPESRIQWNRHQEKATKGVLRVEHRVQNVPVKTVSPPSTQGLSISKVVRRIIPTLTHYRYTEGGTNNADGGDKKTVLYVSGRAEEFHRVKAPHKVFVRNPIKDLRVKDMKPPRYTMYESGSNTSRRVAPHQQIHTERLNNQSVTPWYKKFITQCQSSTKMEHMPPAGKEKEKKLKADTSIVLNAMDDQLQDIVTSNHCYFTYAPDVTVYHKWKILTTLGYGTFASVYKVQHRCTGKLAAAKLLEPQRFDVTTQHRIIEMFAKEIRYLVKCQCPGVVTIYQVIRGLEGWLVVQELVAGGTLWDDSTAQSDMEQFLLFAQLLQTLMELQDKGVVHRDLKPTNILRSKQSSRLCVTDFGWSEGVENLNMYVHELPGTIEINPPEVLNHHPNQCKKIDNYALALNMMLLLSHRFVCRNDKLPTAEAARQMLQSIATIRKGRPLPGFTVESWDVFLGLSEFDVKQRYSLKQVAESTWCVKMLCQLLYRKNLLFVSDKSTNRIDGLLWHASLRSLAQRLERYITISPKVYLLPCKTTVTETGQSASRQPLCKGYDEEHMSPGSRREWIEDSSGPYEGCCEREDESSTLDYDKTTKKNTNKGHSFTPQYDARRKQWSDWLAMSPSPVSTRATSITVESNMSHTLHQLKGNIEESQSIPSIPSLQNIVECRSDKHNKGLSQLNQNCVINKPFLQKSSNSNKTFCCSEARDMKGITLLTPEHMKLVQGAAHKATDRDTDKENSFVPLCVTHRVRIDHETYNARLNDKMRGEELTCTMSRIKPTKQDRPANYSESRYYSKSPTWAIPTFHNSLTFASNARTIKNNNAVTRLCFPLLPYRGTPPTTLYHSNEPSVLLKNQLEYHPLYTTRLRFPPSVVNHRS